MEIFDTDINYCNWLLKQKGHIFKSVQASLSMVASIKYNNYKKNTVVSLDKPYILKCKKHSGKDIIEVFKIDPSYCKWLINRIPLSESNYYDHLMIEDWVEHLINSCVKPLSETLKSSNKSMTYNNIELEDTIISNNTISPNSNIVYDKKEDTVQETYKLFKEGHSLKKISEIRVNFRRRN